MNKQKRCRCRFLSINILFDWLLLLLIIIITLTHATQQQKQQPQHALYNLSRHFNHSYIHQLQSETKQNYIQSNNIIGSLIPPHANPNNTQRPIHNGHYVFVQPSHLYSESTRLVIYSKEVSSSMLRLSEESVRSEEFLRFVSGDVIGAFSSSSSSPSSPPPVWATPYALSIMGKRYTSNCPWNTGDGYGDGRALSIGEVSFFPPSPLKNHRFEIQLKGAGPTPFCRGGDGQAVFRSSMREFLVSEAMFGLGVPTTRALSLIAAGGDGCWVKRPWYSDGLSSSLLDDVSDQNSVALGVVDDEESSSEATSSSTRKMAQIHRARNKRDPDIMIEEECAITCRVSESFLRVAHVDLFARRAEKKMQEYWTRLEEEDDDYVPHYDESLEWDEYINLIHHISQREFNGQCYHPPEEQQDTNHLLLGKTTKCLIQQSLQALSHMTSQWIRVGYIQGNFNGDNCLIGGRTVDYGPFGFVEEYHALMAKWTGSGDHFGFLNQVDAGFRNWVVLLDSLLLTLEHEEEEEDVERYREMMLAKGQNSFHTKVKEVMRIKMGFPKTDDAQVVDELWIELESLMSETRVDWTIFWRRLYWVVKTYPLPNANEEQHPSNNVIFQDMLDLLIAKNDTKIGSSPFYEPLDGIYYTKYLHWIRKWRMTLEQSHEKYNNTHVSPSDKQMRFANPKYVLREWMLVHAYTRASPQKTTSSSSSILFGSSSSSSSSSSKRDDSEIHELHRLMQHPYEEGTDEQDEKYNRRTPEEYLDMGGTTFMS